jgi:small subunit ribosomal protein S16
VAPKAEAAPATEAPKEEAPKAQAAPATEAPKAEAK